MGPLGVVEVDPLADDPFGLEAIRQLVQVAPVGTQKNDLTGLANIV